MEEFKWIPGFEQRYDISDLGRVRSYKGTLRFLKPQPIIKGYLNVALSGKTYLVHRLVLLTFIGPSKLGCNHKDLDKTNNKLNNLEYCTNEENNKHARKKGVWFNQKLTEQNIFDIRQNKILKRSELAKKYNVSWTHINRILKNKCWKI